MKQISVEDCFKVLSGLEYDNCVSKITEFMRSAYEKLKTVQAKKKENLIAIRNLTLSGNFDGKMYLHLDEELKKIQEEPASATPVFLLNYEEIFSSLLESIEKGSLSKGKREQSRSPAVLREGVFKEKYNVLKKETEDLISGYEIEINAYKKALEETRGELRIEKKRVNDLLREGNDKAEIMKQEIDKKDTIIFGLEEKCVCLESERSSLHSKFLEMESERLKHMETEFLKLKEENSQLNKHLAIRLVSLSVPSEISNSTSSSRAKQFSFEFHGSEESERKVLDCWNDVCEYLNGVEKAKRAGFSKALAQMKELANLKHLKDKERDALKAKEAERSFQIKLDAMKSLFDQEKRDWNEKLNEYAQLEERHRRLLDENESLKTKVASVDETIKEKISEQELANDAKMRKLRGEHESSVASLTKLHSAQVRELSDKHQQELVTMDEIHRKLLTSSIQEYELRFRESAGLASLLEQPAQHHQSTLQ